MKPKVRKAKAKRSDLSLRCDACPKLVAQAARLVSRGFSWSKTPQGFLYWQKVYDNLCDLADMPDEKLP